MGTHPPGEREHLGEALMLDAQVTISAPGEDLELETPGVWELVSIQMPARTWRRNTVEGSYQHGRALVSAVMESATLTVVVRCLGDSWEDVEDARKALFGALAQRAYTVTVKVEGEIGTWDAEPADITGGLEKFQAMAGMQEYVLTIPVYPISS